MALDEVLTKVKDSMRAAVVYAEPYEKDGITVIPAATVVGGGGGGTGHDGEGGGFGTIARPAGAFVLQNGTVRWVPAVDANRLVALGFAIVFVVRRLLKRRAAKRRAVTAPR
ncbi:sporulation protein [Actinophytocola sp.]|uniref:sporulation protein n=1 Tax=Actinophytocola sp. TaxID=1872138 RepID=UPI002EDB7223